MDEKEHKQKVVKLMVDSLISEFWSTPIFKLESNSNEISLSHVPQRITSTDQFVSEALKSSVYRNNLEWKIPKWIYVFIDRDGNKIELKEQEYPKEEFKIPVVEGESKMMHFKLKSKLNSDYFAYYMEVYRDE